MTRSSDILRELYQAGTSGISGAGLAERMSVSRAAVWSRIEELRKLGFDIQGSPHGGYRLCGTPDLLLGEDIEARLEMIQVVGRQVQVFRETASTNEIVERLGRDGVREGAVVIAEHQTHGKGRLGRTWCSPGGKSILMSVLLRPDLKPPEVTRLTIIGATAVARAIERITSVQVAIKWPNDVMLGERKVAGILTEMNAEPERVRYAVIGIGLNVNQTESELPSDVPLTPTSLKIETGRTVERAALAAAIIEELDRDYQRIPADFSAVSEEWQRRCMTLGRSVLVRFGDETVEGVAEAIGNDGSLLVRRADGQVCPITGGDVSLRSGPRTSG